MINLQCINLSSAGGSGSGGGQAATPNVDIFGTPVINGSQVSGFSTENYLQMPRVIDFSGTTWQLDFKFTTGANVTTQQNIVDSGFGLAIAVSQGKMLVAMSSNGTSWDLGAHAGTHAVAPNTSYYVRMTFDGAEYTVGIGMDGKTYETDITVDSSASLYPRVIIIGKSTDNRYVFGGSINLSDATLLVNGEVAWSGIKGGSYMSVNMSNITKAGKKKVNDIVSEGEVGVKISKLEKEDHKTSDLSKVYALDGHLTYPTMDIVQELLAVLGATSGYYKGISTGGGYRTSSSANNFETLFAIPCNSRFSISNNATIKHVYLRSADVSWYTSFDSLFRNCRLLEDVDVRNWDTSRVASMSMMFTSDIRLKTIDLSSFDTSLVTSFYLMFGNCDSLESVDIRGFSAASVTDAVGVSSVFTGCPSLRSLIGGSTSLNERVFDGLSISPTFMLSALLDRPSLRAIINGLADLTDATSQTLTIGATLRAKLEQEDIAIATGKNWVIA